MKAIKLLYVFVVAMVAGVFTGCQGTQDGPHSDATKDFADETIFTGVGYITNTVEEKTVINGVDTVIMVEVNDTITTDARIVMTVMHEDSVKKGEEMVAVPVQAVKMNITCNGVVNGKDVVMDETAVFNVSKAFGDYYFSTGAAADSKGYGATNCSGKLVGDELTMSLCMTSKLRLSTSSAAKYYTFVLKKN